ncbi:MAG: OmpA family protein [Gammaproteobacteria bacterium]|nr:OmpA family protein [Gammaproteobacteria bacterium]NNM13022.1 OmpA family protein [Gammaproteobacteria bacterium]
MTNKQTGLLKTVCSAAVLMTVLANTNYASETMTAPDLIADDCSIERCVTDGGFAIEIITNDAPDNTAVGDTEAAANSNERADVYGNFSVRLANGGVVWATEDPAVLQPRLAVRGPTRLAVQGTSLLEDGRFDVYLNYPAFVEKIELLIFDGEDSDLVSPVYTVSNSEKLSATKTYSVFNLSRADLSKLSVFAEDELIYIVRAYDAEGRMDETLQKRIQISDISNYELSQQDRLLKVVSKGRPTPPMLNSQHVGNNAGAGVSEGTLNSTPLQGNVLVMQPQQEPRQVAEQVAVPADYRSYTVTPKFGTRKINLRPDDKAELDRITKEWKNATDVIIEVVGHTDSVRIAPQNRKEFADNYVLSQARAETVADYLASAIGINKDKIIKRGAGPDQPVADNSTSKGRQKNRRVEVNIAGNFPPENPTRTVMHTIAGEAAKISLVDSISTASAPVNTSLVQAMQKLSGENASAPAVDVYSSLPDSDEAPAVVAQNFVGVSDLRIQNIPVYGSRVRITGQDVEKNYKVQINDVTMPLDQYGKFAYEYIMPIGRHQFDVSLQGQSGQVQERGTLDLDVTGKHMFMVALADVNVAQNNIKGSLEQLSVNDEFDEDVFVNGRLAFYLKGKVKGKYLLTAQMDTTEEEIKDVFKNIHRKDPQSVFRRLDPDRYYPVYGDDSTTYSDTDSQGRMYVRVDWDKSRALWGNFNTGITGTSFGQYNRSLYGGQLNYRSLETTELGESKSQLSGFVSEAQSALGHSQFLGTGGSLYYLRHRDILPGSDKIRVEVRDRDSDRVIENVELYRGADYEIDELQGRIILARPLAQITQQYIPFLIKDDPLDGNQVYLIADYEYLPDAFDADHLTTGARGKQWFGDHLAVGATYIDENRSADNEYSLASADVTLQAGPGTYLKLEATETQNAQAQGRFLSDDGGLSFNDVSNTVTPDAKGTALGMEARVNFKERGWTDSNWKAASWWRRIDDNYSTSRRSGNGTDTYEYGAEFSGELSDRLRLSGRTAFVEREGDSEDQRFGLQLDYQLTERSRISGEVRQVREKQFTDTDFSEATLAALQMSYALSAYTEVYLRGQATLDADNGETIGVQNYENNDLVTIGAKHRISDKANIQAEYSEGHRGDAATVGLEYRLNNDHQLYGTYTHSTDSTERGLSDNQFTLGNRSRISNQLSVNTEAQFINDDDQAGITQVFGLNYVPRQDWRVGLSLQHGELDKESELGNSSIDRDAVTLSAAYQNQDVQWTSKVEFRKDEGQGLNAESFDQWITSNRIDVKVNDSFRLLGKATYSETEDKSPRLAGASLEDAKFAEAGIGLAYRPVNDNRWNSLFKYTYLYDLPTLSQSDNDVDQRSNILAAETLYQINQRWKVGGKLAWRTGELRERRNDGEWFESETRFAAIRGRYHLTSNWDGLLEYRWLNVQQDDSTRHGLLMSIDRHVANNFKIGVGYNFTDFSDDLRITDYDSQGWFINLVGKY